MRHCVSPQRKRDFSQVRLNHSAIHSNSYANPSPNYSPSKNSHRQPFKNHPEPRSMQDNLVCVNCFNQKWSQQKKLEHNRAKTKQDDQQNMIMSKIQHHRTQNQEKFFHQTQQINQYNLNKIQENKKKYAQEQLLKQDQEDTQAMLLQQEYQQEMQKKNEAATNQRVALKHQLQKQIQIAKKKRKMNEEEQKNAINHPMISTSIPQELRIQKADLYKQDLLTQIHHNNVKKQRQHEEERNHQESNELQIVTLAEKRKQQAEDENARIKQNFLKEINLKKQREALSKEAINKGKQKDEEVRKALKIENQEYLQGKEFERRKQIDNYLNQLKSQIELNKTKREVESRWLQKESDCSFIGKKEKPVTQSCACCAKEYPKHYLGASS